MILTIPNVSEGRDHEVLAALADVVSAADGVVLLDHCADPSHHRAVFTMAGAPPSLADALGSFVRYAVDHIDLRRHEGVHPRIGAVDVVPLVPLGDTPLTACVDLARRIGAALAERFDLPIFLYEAAATRDDRRRLEAIRRGGLAGLATRLGTPEWVPDFGPARLHPTAGACVVGARNPLVAFNVNLRSDDVTAARAIARQVRESNGGLRAVKAIGVRIATAAHDGVQISLNLTDYRTTSIATAVGAVSDAARARGIDVASTELVGLLPVAAVQGMIDGVAVRDLIPPDRILETRLAQATRAR